MTTSNRQGVHKPVYLLGADARLAERLGRALARVGLSLYRLPGPDALSATGELVADAVLILDTRCLTPGQTVSSLMAGLARPPLLIGIADPRDLALRLQAMRAGARACFLTPVDADLIAARLAVLAGSDARTYRVLVVDDEPIAAAFAAGVLERAGIEARVVGDGLRVFDAIDEFRPDLILMDLLMPGASGIELTSLIREHEGHGRIPIVFLSSELDPGLHVAALRVGGDDFLAKPVSGDRLLEVVRERISRACRSGGAPSTGWDPVTGLANRDLLLRRLEKAIARGGADQPGTGLIVVTPRLAADDRGGDSALAAIAEVARRLVESHELIARLSDAELALFATRSDATRLDALVETLSRGIATDTGIPVALGLARLSPAPDDALTLIARAQAAGGRLGSPGQGAKGRVQGALPLGARQRREAIAALIEEALGGRGLDLLYQPVVALRGRPGELYEVSFRLRAPDGDYVPQSEFRSVARSCALQARIDQWVVEHSLDALCGWRAEHPAVRLFLPLTAAGIAAPDWPAWLRDQILSRDLVRCRPLLQFDTEELAAEPDLLRERFAGLHRLGIAICISRFDLEPVGLALIAGLPVSFVRLARGALSGDQEALGRQVAALHRAARKVIAAGVDDPADVPRIWRSGVDFIQGSLLKLPSPDVGFEFTEIELG
ncbi:MAG: EAL domain-containing protein [Chromatiaceae bacterium]|jgi:CheY-like chemotaxis protein/EAL domain-containing protein (putative c-di-GMP-specific phosphodiesterase class I)|nr:EAL domain-containing protein [Chromatiaceae bacterium]